MFKNEDFSADLLRKLDNFDDLAQKFSSLEDQSNLLEQEREQMFQELQDKGKLQSANAILEQETKKLK